MTLAVTRSDGRERVLRAALHLFGRHGMTATSVRSIAAHAETSAANVMHHFGTKEGLRAAVDASVLDDVAGVLTAAAASVLDPSQELPDPTSVLGDPDVRRYLRRALLEADPAATALVRAMAALVRQQLDDTPTRPDADLDYAAVQVVALLLGPIALGPLLEGFEAQTFTPDAVVRRARADLDLLREGLLRG